MDERNEKIRILLLSVGYVSSKTPSDKQFINDLIEFMPRNIEIAIWSLNDAEESCSKYEVGNRAIVYKNRNRIFHKPLFEDTAESYRPHPTHSNIRNSVEINLSLLWYSISELKKFVELYKPDVLHFTDSVGPIVCLIKCIFFDIPITITKPTVRVSTNRSNRFYKYYIRKSLESADEIFTFTTSAAIEIITTGIHKDKLNVIPWGIKTQGCKISENSNTSIRLRYGCKNEDLLIVVSDRAVVNEIDQTFQLLKSLSSKNKIRFVVAIRPTLFKNKFKCFSCDNVIVENGPDDFYDLLNAADALFSPVSKIELERSSLLPLTWIESMYRKTPVITEYCPGVNNLIKDRKTGFLYETVENIEAIINSLSNKEYLEHCKNEARKEIIERYSVEVLAQNYADMWNKVINKKRGK
jgi:glycosyltransferase involved in cell wall biosynthesis